MKLHWAIIVGIVMILLSSFSSSFTFIHWCKYLLWPGIAFLILGAILSNKE